MATFQIIVKAASFEDAKVHIANHGLNIVRVHNLESVWHQYLFIVSGNPSVIFAWFNQDTGKPVDGFPMGTLLNYKDISKVVT